MESTNPKSEQHASMNTDKVLNDLFKTEFARSYNSRTGNCNIHLATHLLSLVQPHLPPPTAPLRIHDNACGPLILTTQILSSTPFTAHPTLHISATDTSPPFITAAQSQISATPAWNTDRVTVDAGIMDGMDLKFADDTFDVSFTSLAIFAFPDPIKGAREIYRTLKPNGVAAFTTWKHVGWLPLLHAVEARLRPGKPLTKMPFLDVWKVEGKLASTLQEGGFRDVKEGSVMAYAMYESLEAAAKSVGDTLGLMVAGEWTGEERAGLEEGLREVMGEGGKGVVRGERGEVGFEMEAWTGVGWK